MCKYSHTHIHTNSCRPFFTGPESSDTTSASYCVSPSDEAKLTVRCAPPPSNFTAGYACEANRSAPCVFNVTADPCEQVDLSATLPAADIAALLARLATFQVSCVPWLVSYFFSTSVIVVFPTRHLCSRHLYHDCRLCEDHLHHLSCSFGVRVPTSLLEVENYVSKKKSLVMVHFFRLLRYRRMRLQIRTAGSVLTSQP